jgi:hypothetical protein
MIIFRGAASLAVIGLAGTSSLCVVICRTAVAFAVRMTGFHMAGRRISIAMARGLVAIARTLAIAFPAFIVTSAIVVATFSMALITMAVAMAPVIVSGTVVVTIVARVLMAVAVAFARVFALFTSFAVVAGLAAIGSDDQMSGRERHRDDIGWVIVIAADQEQA